MAEVNASGGAATVEKALVLIEALARANRPRGVTELSRELDYNKTTVFRLLETLRRHGYVRQDEAKGLYSLTPKLWLLGVGVINKTSLQRVASDFLRRAAEECGETVFLSILDDDHIIHIDRASPHQPLQIVAAIGSRLPLYSSAAGKAMMVDWSEERIREVARRASPSTEHTIVGADTLVASVDDIRRRGYAVAVDEWQIGVTAVAAPIRDVATEVVGTVAIAGPSSRLYPEQIVSLGRKVARVASQISFELGYRPRTVDLAAQ